MRTTLTVDDDVLQVAQERARVEKRSVGSVLSDLARAGLQADRTPGTGVRRSRAGFVLLPSRGGVVTNELVDRVRDEEGV